MAAPSVSATVGARRRRVRLRQPKAHQAALNYAPAGETLIAHMTRREFSQVLIGPLEEFQADDHARVFFPEFFYQIELSLVAWLMIVDFPDKDHSNRGQTTGQFLNRQTVPGFQIDNYPGFDKSGPPGQARTRSTAPKQNRHDHHSND